MLVELNKMTRWLLAFFMIATMNCLGGATVIDTFEKWRRLADVPDPVGFAGMFAGVLDGELVVGGGSQFTEKPLWLQGKKSFSDKVFILKTSGGRWVEDEIKLPEKGGHFASATTADAIYLIGGVNAQGATASSHVLRRHSGKFVIESLPDLPVPLAYAAASIVDKRLYVVGGQNDVASKKASSQTWILDVGDPSAQWKRGADIPGPGVFVPCMGFDGKSIFLFGGMAFGSEDQLIPSKRAYRYHRMAGIWERVQDMPEARVAPATPCPKLADGRLMVIGGYAEVFSGAPREHPGFSVQSLVYDDTTKKWSAGPVLPKSVVVDRDSSFDPGVGPVGAAPCVIWNGLAVVVSGESRASVRTPSVIALPLQ